MNTLEILKLNYPNGDWVEDVDLIPAGIRVYELDKKIQLIEDVDKKTYIVGIFEKDDWLTDFVKAVGEFSNLEDAIVCIIENC